MSIEQALNRHLGVETDSNNFNKPQIQYILNERNVYQPSVVGQNLSADYESLHALINEVSLKKLYKTGILNIFRKHS